MLRVVRINNNFRFFQLHRIAVSKFNPIRNNHSFLKSKGLSLSDLIYVLCLLGGIGISKLLTEDEQSYELKSIQADQIQTSLKKRTSIDVMINNMDASVSDGVKKIIADNYYLIINGLTLTSLAGIGIVSYLFPMLSLVILSSSLIKDVITGETLFTSANGFIKSLPSLFEYYISGPSNAFSYTLYQQQDFLKKIPDLPEDVKKGVCYALTIMWYLNLSAGDNILDKLKNIDVNTHQKLIEDILTLQRSHGTSISTAKIKGIAQYRLKFNEKLTKEDWADFTDHHARMAKIKDAITLAMENVGSLVLLISRTPEKKLNSHITGIIVDKQADNYLIRYFDSNNQEMVFTDALSAQISISRSQAYHYLSQDMNELGYGAWELQEKPFLFWKSTTDIRAATVSAGNLFSRIELKL